MAAAQMPVMDMLVPSVKCPIYFVNMFWKMEHCYSCLGDKPRTLKWRNSQVVFSWFSQALNGEMEEKYTKHVWASGVIRVPDVGSRRLNWGNSFHKTQAVWSIL